MAHERLLPIIYRLFEAATDAGKWNGFLAELAACFNARGAQIGRGQIADKALSFSALYGFDEAIQSCYGGSGGLKEAIARFEEHFTGLWPADPRMEIMHRYPGRPFSCRMLINERDLRQSEAYKQILDPLDAEYALLLSLVEDDGSSIMLGLFRRKSGQSFTQADVELLSDLIPFIRQAIGISERLTRATIDNTRALDTLDKIPLGILLVTRDARVVQANATARAVAEQNDGLHFGHERLRLHSKTEERQLYEAVRSAAMSSIEERDCPTTPLSISRPSEKPALSAIVTPLGSNAFNASFHTAGEPCAAIFLSVPERPLEAPADLLRRLFALTAAQARVCELLVSGATLQQAADQLGISHETARVHLKGIFVNTGVHKQSELIAKILSTPVWIARQSVPGNGRTATMLSWD